MLCSERSAPETGPPTTPASAIAVMKSEIALPRSRAGNQYVRYKIMPGKKPASATPSRKRSV